MLLQLQRYDIDMEIVPGKDIPFADTLSRKYLPDTYSEIAEVLEIHVHAVMSQLPVSDGKMQLIRSSNQYAV